MTTQHEDSPVVQWAVARGMQTGQPSEYEVQQDMHQHLDEAQDLVRPEAPQPPRMGRLKKVAAIGALTAGAVAAGVAVNNAFDNDRIMNPDRGNPEDTNHTDDTVVLPNGQTVVTSDPSANTETNSQPQP